MRTRMATAVILAAGIPWAGGVRAQQPKVEEGAMVAAGQWARGQLPSGTLALDPHRSDGGVGEAVSRAVGRALGAQLTTLEEARTCDDVMDASSCKLSVDALLAISPPVVHGDDATVRVYAWHRGSSARNPVEKATWDVHLRRSGQGWTAVSGEPR